MTAWPRSMRRLWAGLKLVLLVAGAVFAAPPIIVLVIYFAAVLGASIVVLGSGWQDNANDRQRHGGERHVEQLVAEGLGLRWHGRRRFELRDVLGVPMRRACLYTWRRPVAPDHEARALAQRSLRPVWWMESGDGATLAVEHVDGRVTAYRIKWQGVLFHWGRSFHFSYPLGRSSACARAGQLRFVPARGSPLGFDVYEDPP